MVAAVGAALPGAPAAGLVRVLVAPQVRDGVLEGAATGPCGPLPAHRRAEEGVAVRVHGRVVVHAVVAGVTLGLRLPGTDSDLSLDMRIRPSLRMRQPASKVKQRADTEAMWVKV